MTRPSPARRLGLASVAALALAVPTACGGSSHEEGGAAFFPTVLEAMRGAGTAHVEITSTTEGGPGARYLTLTGEARFEQDSVDLAASDSGAGAFSMVLLDGVLYVQGQGLDLGAREWLRIDTTKASSGSSLFGALARTANPMGTFAALGEPDELELVGEEEVDGVATDHYRIAYASETFAEAMEVPAAVARFLPEQVAVEVWVDGDHLPRRFRQEVETSIPNGPTSTALVQGTYSDYGTEVDIEAPADSEVTDRLPFGGRQRG